MIPHQRDKGNEANPERFEMIKKTSSTMQNDGLNNLNYDVSYVALNNVPTQLRLC